MQKCWKTDPQDRPNFAKLADIFDKMLQQKTVNTSANSMLYSAYEMLYN